MVNEKLFSVISWEVYGSDDNKLLGMASVDLSELTFLTTELKGAGILGSFEVPVRAQLENTQLTLHFHSLSEYATRFLNTNAQSLVLYAANERYDAADGTRQAAQLRVAVRGLTASVNLGKVETGEQADAEVVINVDRLTIEEDGKELFAFDRFNNVYRVNGVNLLEDINRALGY